jgi:hypothetical protein
MLAGGYRTGGEGGLFTIFFCFLILNKQIKRPAVTFVECESRGLEGQQCQDCIFSDGIDRAYDVVRPLAAPLVVQLSLGVEGKKSGETRCIRTTQRTALFRE